MKVYLLQWHFRDSSGYDRSDGLLGVYSSEEAADIAGDAWVAYEDSEYYTYTITEMEIND